MLNLTALNPALICTPPLCPFCGFGSQMVRFLFVMFLSSFCQKRKLVHAGGVNPSLRSRKNLI